MIYEASEDFIKELIGKGKDYIIVADKFTDKGIETTIKYTSFDGNQESIQVLFYCDVYISDNDDNTYYFEDDVIKSEDTDQVYEGTDLNSDVTWINLFDLTKVLSDKQQSDLYEQVDMMAGEVIFDALHGGL